MNHFISTSCKGEFCKICGLPAAHKVGEEVMHDDPQPARHNLTAYLCCAHFAMVMGPIATAQCLRPGIKVAKLPPEWLSLELIVRHMIREVLERRQLDVFMRQQLMHWLADVPQDIHLPQFTPKHIFPIVAAYYLLVLNEG